jgi:nucleolar protein 15
MNSYLLFGHILKCQVVPPEQVHEGLFIGANRKFRKVPWNKIEGWKLEKGKTRESWDGKVAKEKKKRSKKNKALEKIGYEYQGPELKTTNDVPVRDDPPSPVAAALETSNEAVIPNADAPHALKATEEVEAPEPGKNTTAPVKSEGSPPAPNPENSEKKKKKRKRSGKGKGKGESSVGADASGASD